MGEDSGEQMLEMLQGLSDNTKAIRSFSTRALHFPRQFDAVFARQNYHSFFDPSKTEEEIKLNLIDNFRQNENLFIFVEQLLQKLSDQSTSVPHESIVAFSNLKKSIFEIKNFIPNLISLTSEHNKLLKSSLQDASTLLPSSVKSGNYEELAKNLQQLLLREIKAVGILLITISKYEGLSDVELVDLALFLSQLESVTAEFKYLYLTFLSNMSLIGLQERTIFSPETYRKMKDLFSRKWANDAIKASSLLAWIYFLNYQLNSASDFEPRPLAQIDIDILKRGFPFRTLEFYRLLEILAENNFPALEIVEKDLEYVDEDIDDDFAEFSHSVPHLY